MPLAMALSPGHYRVTSPILVNAKDGSLLVRVPVGKFEMGDGEGSDEPKHKVELSEYLIGVNCVTNRQYEVFVKATGHRKPETADLGPAIWKNGGYPADKADHPVVFVSWVDAQAYAKWAGCQLPTEAQWEKAAEGPLGLRYPWGKDWKPKLCRNNSREGGGTTAPVMEFPKGASGYGTYQQIGNVWEWCWMSNERSARVARGGSWYGDAEGSPRELDRFRPGPNERYENRGFRLVRAV